jgi:HTH-type transcriptional regulator/antitoxin HigA
MENIKRAKVFPPGDFIKEELDARGWTQLDLAEILDRPVPTINQIISGKKAITPETALGLAKAFGTSAEIWLNLENAYRLSLVENNSSDVSRRARLYSLAPVREMVKRGWLDTADNLNTLEKELCEFFRIETIEQRPKFAFAARKSDDYENYNAGQIAWFFKARQLAENIKVTEFSALRLKNEIQNLPRFSITDERMAQLPFILKEMGIRLVIVEHLPQTYIDGAAFWLDDHSPVVAVSFRYDRIDSFWFTLMHELAHILQSKNKDTFLDDNLILPPQETQEKKSSVERDADSLASEWLIPQNLLNNFIKSTKPFYSKKKITAFAHQIGIHPGIVVGRLHYLKEIPYANHRALLMKVHHLFLSESV